MAIFVKGKNGDAMGSYAWSRPTKEQRKAWRQKKESEEEKRINESHYTVKRQAAKFEEVVKAQLKSVGIDKG